MFCISLEITIGFEASTYTFSEDTGMVPLLLDDGVVNTDPDDIFLLNVTTTDGSAKGIGIKICMQYVFRLNM